MPCEVADDSHWHITLLLDEECVFKCGYWFNQTFSRLEDVQPRWMHSLVSLVRSQDDGPRFSQVSSSARAKR